MLFLFWSIPLPAHIFLQHTSHTWLAVSYHIIHQEIPFLSLICSKFSNFMSSYKSVHTQIFILLVNGRFFEAKLSNYLEPPDNGCKNGHQNFSLLVIKLCRSWTLGQIALIIDSCYQGLYDNEIIKMEFYHIRVCVSYVLNPTCGGLRNLKFWSEQRAPAQQSGHYTKHYFSLSLSFFLSLSLSSLFFSKKGLS